MFLHRSRPSSSRSPALRRPLSAVSLDGVLDQADGRVKRVKVLSEDQRKAISQLTNSSQIPHAERKRQFGALHRRMEHANTLPAGVLAKWERATTPQQKPGSKVTCSQKTPITKRYPHVSLANKNIFGTCICVNFGIDK